ncbi:hypothetical protein Tco_0231107 [Tanacetum coccineum]
MMRNPHHPEKAMYQWPDAFEQKGTSRQEGKPENLSLDRRGAVWFIANSKETQKSPSRRNWIPWGHGTIVSKQEVGCLATGPEDL